MKTQQGVSLYLTIAILAVMTVALLALLTISLSQIKIIWTIGHSVIAFFAADTGIELVLTERANPASTYSGYLDLNNNGQEDTNEDSFYEVTVTAAGAQCSADNYCIKSVGRYRETKRAIEVSY